MAEIGLEFKVWKIWGVESPLLPDTGANPMKFTYDLIMGDSSRLLRLDRSIKLINGDRCLWFTKKDPILVAEGFEFSPEQQRALNIYEPRENYRSIMLDYLSNSNTSDIVLETHRQMQRPEEIQFYREDILIGNYPENNRAVNFALRSD